MAVINSKQIVELEQSALWALLTACQLRFATLEEDAPPAIWRGVEEYPEVVVAFSKVLRTAMQAQRRVELLGVL
jgi:hypothetical protein